MQIRGRQSSRQIGWNRIKRCKRFRVIMTVSPLLLLMVVYNFVWFENLSPVSETAATARMQANAEMQTKLRTNNLSKFETKFVKEEMKVAYVPQSAPPISPSPSSHLQSPSKTFQGRLYACNWQGIARYMFPEYEFMGTDKWKTNATNENDILVAALPPWGKCIDRRDEKRLFGGKILYINAEPVGDPVSMAWKEKQKYHIEKIYQIGPYPKKRSSDKAYEDYRERHSIQVYQATMNFFSSIYRDTGSDTDDLFDPWKQMTEGNGGTHKNQGTRIPAIIYIHRHCVSFRQNAAALLAKTFRDIAVSGSTQQEKASTNKKHETASSSFLHYGGECKVEGGIPVPPAIREKWENKKRSQFESNYKTIYTRYKYCLVMENRKKDGYITEKLVHALLAGCLPIYYGSRDVYKIFREDAFVYFDVKNPNMALREIRNLENNHTEYLRRTNRALPLLRVTSNGDTLSTAATVDEYFSLFPTIGTGKLCREIHQKMGLPIPKSLARNNEDLARV